MKALGDTFKIKHTLIQNRICFPPMVCFKYDHADGMVREESVKHYRTLAKGGAGLLIQEATCINPNGKLAPLQLGIWSDDQIDGLKKITTAVHEEGGTLILQIHHAGVVGIAEDPLCPSPYQFNEKTGKEMSLEEIAQTQKDFVEAARRAYLAGYDGVELHGCHNYLICQFLNPRVNKRTDMYGETPIKFVTEILDEIRKITPENFIVGIRLGAFEPTLEESIKNSIILEKAGIDFLDISFGFVPESEPYAPEGYPFDTRIYAAEEIKKKVSIPVFAVGNIHTPETAKAVLEKTNVDMVDVGRSMLVDPDWAIKAQNGEMPGYCVNCPACKWNSNACPGQKRMEQLKESDTCS